jgi:transcriptional regulator with XRE-family HTH domain
MNPNDNGNRAVTLAVDLNGRLAPSTEEIGSRIRFLRRQRKLTLEELAASSGITKSYLSKIERGISVPSSSTALKVAGAFSITISQLVGEEQADEAICVVRKGERKHFMRDGSEQGYNYEMLAAPKRFKNMEPFIMHPPREFQENRFFEHPGEEFILVLSGVVEIEFVNRRIELEAGDAIYFDAHLPHRSRSLGGKPAEAMVVVMG